MSDENRGLHRVHANDIIDVLSCKLFVLNGDMSKHCCYWVPCQLSEVTAPPSHVLVWLKKFDLLFLRNEEEGIQLEHARLLKRWLDQSARTCKVRDRYNQERVWVANQVLDMLLLWLRKLYMTSFRFHSYEEWFRVNNQRNICSQWHISELRLILH